MTMKETGAATGTASPHTVEVSVNGKSVTLGRSQLTAREIVAAAASQHAAEHPGDQLGQCIDPKTTVTVRPGEVFITRSPFSE